MRLPAGPVSLAGSARHWAYGAPPLGSLPPTRHVFALVAIKDRAAGVWNPSGLHELRTALDWARRGGEPGIPPERPDPAPVSPRWLNDNERHR